MAKRQVERVKNEQKTLLNSNGYDNPIVEIKPALVIGEMDVDRLIKALDRVSGTL